MIILNHNRNIRINNIKIELSILHLLIVYVRCYDSAMLCGFCLCLWCFCGCQYFVVVIIGDWLNGAGTVIVPMVLAVQKKQNRKLNQREKKEKK